MNTSHTKVTNKKKLKKGEYTGTLLSSLSKAYFTRFQHKIFSKPITIVNVIGTHSGKQTHSEGQCRQWSAVYYTGGPKAESPLSQGPRPAFMKIFYTLCVRVQTHQPKSLEAYKGRVNTITITPSFTCYVFKQLIINQLLHSITSWLHSNQSITDKPVVTFQRQGWLVSIFSQAMSNLDVTFKILLPRGGLILPLSFPQVLSTKFRVHWRGGCARTSTGRPEMESRPYEFLLH